MLTSTTRLLRVRYSSPVSRCVRRLRVLPPAVRGNQEVLKAHWCCTPPADAMSEDFDEFGNRVLELRHHRIEGELCFELSFLSKRKTCDATRDENLPPTGIGAFLLPSRLCDASLAIQDAAREASGEPGQGFAKTQRILLAEKLCGWTHRALSYAPNSTQLDTTASQALARGRGVCQDYAHLMIALCRARQIPARYVSGYNAGEGAMHAWVEVLCVHSWLAFDPTHNRRTRNDCVFVAAGRDFRDVSPILGTYRGKATAQVETRCRTTIERPTEPPQV